MAYDKDVAGHDEVEKADIGPVTNEIESLKLLEGRAKEGQKAEHGLAPLQAIKAYPMAIFWSFMVSMCVVMEGYDTIL